MRFVTPVLALLAAVATAQQNAINIPAGGLQVVANTPMTLTWTNPSSGTVTIKLQQGSAITSESGLVVVAQVPASDETSTFTIPGNQVNTAQYTFEIVDDSNPDNYNFSPGFTISGATCSTCTGTPTQATVVPTSTVGTSSDSAASGSTSLPGLTTTGSSTLSTMTVTSSSMPSAAASSSTSSEPSSSPTSISNTNGAGSLTVQGGLIAAMIGAMAVL